MTPLADRHCEVCRPGTPTLSAGETEQLLKELDDWRVVDRGGHQELTKTYRFKGFMPGVRFVDAIAEVAEAEGHHPDLRLTYGELTVDLWTHVAGGLTDNDFILAAKIDQNRPA